MNPVKPKYSDTVKADLRISKRSRQIISLYDGKPLDFRDPDSIVESNGYYLAPAGILASLTGWSMQTDADSVRFTNEVLGLDMQVNIGVKKFIINGQERVTEGAPELINGVVMVPFKDFFYAMNCSVKWDEKTSTFIIKSPLAKVFSDKNVIIHKAGTTPVIDSKADDAAWAGAWENGNFTTVYYNEKPKADTSFKAVYDDNAIYFFIKCDGKPVSLEGLALVLAPSSITGSSAPFFNAVLIPEPSNTTPKDGKNRTGGLRVKYGLGTRGNDLVQGTGFDARYIVNDTSWSAEVKIPYDRLVTSSGTAPVPANTAEWRMNIIRVRPFTEGASSWVPIRTSIASDDLITGDMSYTAVFAYAPATGMTGSIFFEGYPATSVFNGIQMPYVSVVPQNAGLRYMGYDTKLVFFDKNDELNVKKARFHAEWIDQLDAKHKAEIIKITEKNYKLYFTIKHPSMSNDGLYRLNIYVDKNSDVVGKVTGTVNTVQKYEMMFDRQQVMDAGVIYSNWAVDRAPSNKTILPDTNLKQSEQSDTVKNLIKIIPETIGFTLNGIPVDNPDKWSYDLASNTFGVVDKSGNNILSVTFTKNVDGTYTYNTTPDIYKDNGCLSVTSATGKLVKFPYYEDASGKRYFIGGQLNRHAKYNIDFQIYSLTQTDPLGAGYVLYEIAKAYRDWVPFYDYYNNCYPIDPGWGPPYGYFGGILSRWNFEELYGVKCYCDAYAAIKNTNALDIVGSQVGENAEELIISMFSEEAKYKSTFPNYSMNMDYKNWEGLISISKATGDPDYVHQAISLIDEYAKGHILLDGFWEEVSMSYHWQSIRGLLETLDYIKGWSDPEGYISPRTGVNVQNLDMSTWYPILSASKLLESTVSYPDGKYLTIQDTWEIDTIKTADTPQTGSILLPAANIARMSKGTGTNTSQLYMTYAPQYGAHYHYDPLSIALYSNGQVLLPDLGYTHTQFRTFAISTIGHNTVTVDSKDAFGPLSANYGGQVENYADIDSTVQIMKAHQENAYPGITREYNREPWYIQMEGSNDSYVLDIFRVDGGNRHEYSLNGSATSKTVTFTPNAAMIPYNQDSNTDNNDAGRLLPEGTKVTLPVSETDGGRAEYNGQQLYKPYICVTDVRKSDLADGKYEITMATNNGTADTAGMKITGFAGDNSQLFIGKVPSLNGAGKGTSPTVTNYTPKMVVRREGTNLQSTFVNVMEPYAAGSSAEIKTIEKLAAGNARDVAVKISYTTAAGDITDVLISSSNPSAPLTVSDSTLGSFTLTGKMAFVRYLKGQDNVYHAAKVYTVETGSLVVNGENIAGAGKVEGNVVRTMRTANGDSLQGFAVDTAVPDIAVGKTITIKHPDGSVNAFKVTSVTPEGNNTIVGISGGDPGFDILPDGSSQLRFYPSTKWTGVHTFKIAMDTVKDYVLTAK